MSGQLHDRLVGMVVVWTFLFASALGLWLAYQATFGCR